ncbi:MAG: PIN domain-containing protein [Thiobacillus sp.]|nr:PIN domain-containing protein [Thiobacillus sp.]
MAEPLLVIDTNVMLDLLHFDDAAARPLRLALEAGRLRCVVTHSTLGEWRRVLAYPEFGLDPAQQAALVARYQSMSEMARTVEVDASLPHKEAPIHYGLLSTPGGKPVWSRMPHKGTPIHYGLKPVWSRMPRCSDPDDQKFIELAAAAHAQGLVSKDRAVLKLRRRCAPLFRIMTPTEVARWLEILPA